ncbi:MAG: 50S ribosomal protein L11 methyltransferase [Thermodesulfobacteriota bacterium]
MISPDTVLHIYELKGSVPAELCPGVESFVGLWNEEDFCYLFFTSREDRYVDRVSEESGAVLTDRYEMTYRDWQSGIPYAGLCVGDVKLVPADHPDPPEKAILIDPSVVFGDGSHPTTLRCLSIMEAIVRDHRIESVLDLGTGSGILALAAAALGVPRVRAVDRNVLAIRTARNNVRINSLSDVIDVREGEASWFMDQPCDLVAANLPFQVLRDIVQMRQAALQRWWIVSGINRQQAEILQELLRENGIHTIAEYEDPPWVTFAARKPARDPVHR